MARKAAIPRMHDLDDLILGSQVAEICGVSRAAVTNWFKRGTKGVPEPLVVIVSESGDHTTPLYSRKAITEWAATRIESIKQRGDRLLAQLEQVERTIGAAGVHKK